MKKFALLAIIALAGTPAFAAETYQPGNFLLGVGLGAGNPFLGKNPSGVSQLTINPSAEIIFGTWAPSGVGLALGLKIDSSVNFINMFSASLAPMASLHVSITEVADWYVGLGLGFELLPSGRFSNTSLGGSYAFGLAFETGFNYYFTKNIGMYVGMGIHADEIFGAAGVKFRFGDVKSVTSTKL